jgi:hypothetical protein
MLELAPAEPNWEPTGVARLRPEPETGPVATPAPFCVREQPRLTFGTKLRDAPAFPGKRARPAFSDIALHLPPAILAGTQEGKAVMRIVVALAILIVTLAGCGQRPGQNDQNAAGLPTPGPRPGGNQVADQNSDRAFRQGYRDLNIATCISSAQSRAAQGDGAPPGTDFRPACTCYIDRAMAGLSVEQLSRLEPGPREQAILEQCAREHGFAENTGGK